MIDDPRLPDRFWAKVSPEPTTGCWLWTGGLNKESSGYGRFSSGARDALAHRHAYEALIGPIPEGLQLDHLCRVRCCVNPAHLEPVTSRENTMRGLSPSAINATRTHCPQGHQYSDDNVIIGTRGSRLCRQCQHDHKIEWSRRQRSQPPPPGVCVTCRSRPYDEGHRTCQRCRLAARVRMRARRAARKARAAEVAR